MTRLTATVTTARGRFRSGVRVGTLTFALAILLAATAVAQTYYVDIQSPAGSPAGPGTEISPYNSISAAVAARKGPGVTIVVKPGLYREEVSVPASGLPGNPYVIRAQGPGVVIDGADDYSNQALWVRDATVSTGGRHGLAYVAENVWLAPGVTWGVQQVFVDGVRLTRSSASPGVLPVNAFTCVPGEGLYVNLGGDNPGTRLTLVGTRANGIKFSSRSWVTIDGFEVVHTEDRAINIQNGCSDLVISNNRVRLAGEYGIKTVNGARLLIAGNVVSDCLSHGIGLTTGANGCVVRDNESFRNVDPHVRVAKGIYLFQAPGNVIVGNNVHDNQDTGIHFGNGSNDCIAYNNRSWNNGDHGYDHLYSSGTIHVNNVAFANYKDGFSIEGESPNTRVFNCIAVDNGLASDQFNLWVNAQSAVGFQSDYNIFWNSTAQMPIKFIATKYAVLDGYRTASGQDAHSMQASPLFVDGPAGDFRLQPGSPAIDAGTSAVAYWPQVDAAGHLRMDDVSTPDLGTGPVTYADIGAFEFVAGATPATLRQAMGIMGRGAVQPGSGVGGVALSNGFPNPSRGAVEFALDLPEEARVRWEVFDLQGRSVWREERALAAGRSRLTWDGRNAGGTPVGTGIYLVRAQVDAQQLTRRVVRF